MVEGNTGIKLETSLIWWHLKLYCSCPALSDRCKERDCRFSFKYPWNIQLMKFWLKPYQKSRKQRTNTQLTVKTGTEESLHWRADSVLVTFCHIGSIFVSLVKYIYISAILYAIYMLSKLIGVWWKFIS